MNRTKATAVYAAGHFLIDLLCAYGMFIGQGQPGWTTAVLWYNFCAFALQMPLGLLADRFRRDRSLAAAGCVLVGLAALYLRDAPAIFAVVAGVGNALYHVGGGVVVLHAWPEKAGPLGAFVAPGAFGICFGTMLGKAASLFLFPMLAALGFVLLTILIDCRTEIAPPMDAEAGKAPFAALACLFLVVCLRSYAGFCFRFAWKTGAWVVVSAAGVVLGKTAGGFLSDRFGLWKTSVGSLGAAALLFLFSHNAVCGVLAVFLFNMTMPVTLRAAADALPGLKGFSFGLLTFALFLGFLPTWMGAPSPAGGPALALLALASLTLLLPGLRKTR